MKRFIPAYTRHPYPIGAIRSLCLVLALLTLGSRIQAAGVIEQEPVIVKEKTVHQPGCSRLSGDTSDWEKVTLKDAELKGLRITCGRCARGLSRKYKIKFFERETTPIEYDPDMTVYSQALWMKVHAADCPAIAPHKDKRNTMTLAEADKAGYGIGGGGKTACCLVGYKRKYPEKELDDDTIIAGTMEQNRWKHVVGCHRYWPGRSHVRRTMKEWTDDGFGICGHCKRRGPKIASVSEEDWQTMDPTTGIMEVPFSDPMASCEHFMGMRFFFPNGHWYGMYRDYRGTGDKSHLDDLLVSARHYNNLSTEWPEYAQKKARDPEGAAFMLSMATWSRITLQNALKYPSKVSPQEIAEAETFLRTMLSVLEPNWAGRENLDSEMGVPKPLADDFRRRQGNRAINGIGTVGMMTAALKDLQKQKGSRAYQSQIDHYDRTIQNWLSYFKDSGYICKETNGFYYAYKPEGNRVRDVNGCKAFRRPEDNSHWRFTINGLVFLYDGGHVDDAFMTSVATTVHDALANRQGAFTCPCVPKARVKDFRGESEEYIVLNAFVDGTSKGRGGDTASWEQTAQYLSALRKDNTAIYVGE